MVLRNVLKNEFRFIYIFLPQRNMVILIWNAGVCWWLWHGVSGTEYSVGMRLGGTLREEEGRSRRGRGWVKLWCSPMADLANPMGALPLKASVRAVRPVPLHPHRNHSWDVGCLEKDVTLDEAALQLRQTWQGCPKAGGIAPAQGVGATSLSLKGDVGSGLSPPSQMLIFIICQKLHPFTTIYTYDGKF